MQELTKLRERIARVEEQSHNIKEDIEEIKDSINNIAKDISEINRLKVYIISASGTVAALIFIVWEVIKYLK